MENSNIIIKSLGSQRASIKGVIIIEQTDVSKWPEQCKKAHSNKMFPFICSVKDNQLEIDDYGNTLAFFVHKNGNLIGTRANTLLILQNRKDKKILIR